MTNSSTKSLTAQSLLLTLGRFASYPFTFMAPLIFVRYFSPTDFGYYKQLVVLFYILVPAVNLGFSHAILYFVPRSKTAAKLYISKSLVYQIVIGCLLICASYLLQDQIKLFFPKSPKITDYIPLIVIHAFFWAISNNLEEVLLVEFRPKSASIFDLLSEIGRALFPVIAILFDADLYIFLLSMVAVGILRTITMFFYFLRKNYLCSFSMTFPDAFVTYSLPLGAAILARFGMTYSHLLIVSFLVPPEIFAIFSVGCFTLPVLGPLLTAVARVAIVRISELSQVNNYKLMAEVILNSNRKTWLFLFPLFLFCMVNAESLIVVLYTENYIPSIPIFQIFILTIPFMAIHLEHLPRAFGNTDFLLRLNAFSLLISIPLVIGFYAIAEVYGAVLSAVIIFVIRQISLLRMTQKKLNVRVREIIPYPTISRSMLPTFVCGLGNFFVNQLLDFSHLKLLIVSSIFYWSFLLFMFWFLNLINTDEKSQIINGYKTMVSRIYGKNQPE